MVPDRTLIVIMFMYTHIYKIKFTFFNSIYDGSSINNEEDENVILFNGKYVNESLVYRDISQQQLARVDSIKLLVAPCV